MVIACDFDGVIHNWDHPIEGRHMGPPFEGAKEALTQIQAQGHRIIIHSCNRKDVIEKFMAYYELPYNYIWDQVGKPIADVYLDDRAITFTTWPRFMELLSAI